MIGQVHFELMCEMRRFYPNIDVVTLKTVTFELLTQRKGRPTSFWLIILKMVQTASLI